MIDKLIFFDFDYTLAKTIEHVRIWSPRGTRTYKGKYYRIANPLEYNLLKLADDEYLDDDSFIEFNKIDIKKAIPITLNLYLLNFFMIEENNNTMILSARPQRVENYIFDFLKAHNIKNYNKITFKGCGSSDPSLKYDYIKEQTLRFKPKEVLLFDDSTKVVDFAKNNFHNDFKDIKFMNCLIKNKTHSTCLCFEETKNLMELK